MKTFIRTLIHNVKLTFIEGLNPTIIMLAFLIYAFIVKIWQYGMNRSYYMDEIFLLRSIISRPLTGFTTTLEWMQRAPLGFLVVERWVYQLVGRDDELIMRLFPFIVGLFSVPLLFIILKRWTTPLVGMLASFLFATCWAIAYYSADMKPYGIDVTLTLLLTVLFGQVFYERTGRYWWLILCIVGICVIPFSFPAVIVMASLGLTYLVAHRPSRFIIPDMLFAWRAPLICYSTWLVIFAVYYRWFLIPTSGNDQQLQLFWGNLKAGFLPLDATAVAWLITTAERAVENPLGFGRATGDLALFLILVGSIYLLRQSKERFFFFAAPIVMSLALAALHVYPFVERMILFLVPNFFILIAYGVQSIFDYLQPQYRKIGLVLVAIVCIYPLAHLSPIMRRQEIRPIVSYIDKHWQENDRVYVSYSSQFSFEYYAAKSQHVGSDYQIGSLYHDSWSNYSAEIAPLYGHNRVWVVVSTNVVDPSIPIDESAIIIQAFDAQGQRKEVWGEPGAFVYLYDLSEKAMQGVEDQLQHRRTEKREFYDFW